MQGRRTAGARPNGGRKDIRLPHPSLLPFVDQSLRRSASQMISHAARGESRRRDRGRRLAQTAAERRSGYRGPPPGPRLPLPPPMSLFGGPIAGRLGFELNGLNELNELIQAGALSSGARPEWQGRAPDRRGRGG